jgi:hypothetical protein
LEGIRLLFENAEFEKRVLETVQGQDDLSNQPDDQELAKLEQEREVAEDEAQALFAQIAGQQVKATFEGDPRAEVESAKVQKRAIIAGLNWGNKSLIKGVALAERGRVVEALDLVRQYAVSLQSDAEALEELSSKLAYTVAHSQAWHERRSDEAAKDSLWTDAKVSASELGQEFAFVVRQIGDEYHNLGGVEGSISAYWKKQRTEAWDELKRAQQAVVSKQEHLTTARKNSEELEKQLTRLDRLTGLRIAEHTEGLKRLLLNNQLWHLTWGVFAGLVGALLCELINIERVRRLRTFLWGIGRRIRTETPAKESENRHHPNAIFSMVGLMLGAVLSIKLGDRLEEFSSHLVDIATRNLFGFALFLLFMGLIGTLTGGFGARLLTPKPLHHALAKPRVSVIGVGGFVGGLLGAVVLTWVSRGHHIVSDSAQAVCLALALLGGLFGALIGTTLLVRHRRAS